MRTDARIGKGREIKMTDAIQWSPPSSVDDEPSAEEALARRLSDLLAIPRERLLTLNLDIPSLIASGLGALPAMHSLLPDFARILPTFDPSLVQKLEDYILILNYTNLAYRVLTRPPRCPRPLIEEGRTLRTLLISYLKPLAQRGQVDSRKWRNLQGTRGYQNLATDLGILCKIFEQTPALVHERSVVTREDVRRARELMILILTHTGSFGRTPEEIERAAELRQRAFTLVVLTYCAIRRAALYVRWEHDLGNKLVPSLFKNRRRARRRSKASKEETQTQTQVITAPVAVVTVSEDVGADEHAEGVIPDKRLN